MLGGLWEFPGGKQRIGETVEEALVRKVEEETGVQVQVGFKHQVLDHAFTHFTIRVHAFLCQRAKGAARALGYSQVKWVAPDIISTYPLPAVDKKIWDRLSL
jgi:A/G-specific adenine glycosylase